MKRTSYLSVVCIMTVLISHQANASVKSFLMSCPAFGLAKALVNDGAIEAKIRQADALGSLVPNLAFRRQQANTVRGLSYETQYGLQGQIRNPIRLINELSMASNQSAGIESYGRKSQLETVYQLIQSYYEWKSYAEYGKALESWRKFFEKRSEADLSDASPGTIRLAVESVAMLHELNSVQAKMQELEAEFKKCSEADQNFSFPKLNEAQLQQISKTSSNLITEQERICEFESKVKDSQIAISKSGWIPELRYSYFKTLTNNGVLSSDADWSLSLNFTIPFSLLAGSPSGVTRCDVELAKQRQTILNRNVDVTSDYQSISQLKIARGRMNKLIQLVRPEAEVGIVGVEKLNILFREYKKILDQLVRAEVNVVQKAWEFIE